MNGFHALAHYYDRFVGADYGRIVGFIHENLQKYCGEGSLICDVGCGSGTVALKLLKKGYDLIGIDGSPEMLNEAIQKKDCLPQSDRILFLCQELPDFELFGTVDAIISTLDTLNYLTDEQQLHRLFYWFYNYLNPNGILIFDLNTLHKYRDVLDNNCDIFEEDGVFLNWRSQFDGMICSHSLTIFEKMPNGFYQRNDEEQFQRYYSMEEITAMLERYHFELLDICDCYSKSRPNDQSERLTFVARCKKGV
ncbi:MAG: SAM-dependent methyltransferase [Clostridiales bacterium]|mgnify:FL=1|nr:MAG: SAM-dependent methyltransferase [Clostridiales bacterium]